jgi:hypothetical protein
MGELLFFVTDGSYLIIPFLFDAPETESIYMIRNAHFVYLNLVVFELSVDIPMDTNYAPFPADYSFISMKRTTVKRITPVVAALFRVDINHTYNTNSNELLKSTMVYNN